MISAPMWVWLLFSIPVAWRFLSKLEKMSGFIFIASISNYIKYKLIVCVLFGWIIAPVTAIYSFIKADKHERKMVAGIVISFLVLEGGAFLYSSVQNARQEEAELQHERMIQEKEKAKAQAKENQVSKPASATMGNITANETPIPRSRG